MIIIQLMGHLSARLGILAAPGYFILLFFVYSFLGNIMECVVLSVEQRRLVTNRGFVRHLPFCVIYGFGALIGVVLLAPLRDTWVLLFTVGAMCATLFEYTVAKLQIRLFGSFWWDYSHKPFNYKGILCLESTLGWGVVALVIIKALHPFLAALVSVMRPTPALVVGLLLLLAYSTDFVHSARAARRQKMEASAAFLETSLEAEE